MAVRKRPFADPRSPPRDAVALSRQFLIPELSTSIYKMQGEAVFPC
jgi:hypothetical protein